MDINHQFVVIAYVLTWVIQLGYVAYVVTKWRREKQKAASNPGSRR
jgi:hypothetical protein